MNKLKAVLAGLFFIAGLVSVANAVDPSDNGVWASDQTLFQGFNLVYAPTAVPSVIAFWYTYDENGNQAWFISDSIPVESTRSEDVVDIYKPICTFTDDGSECAVGDSVGILAIGRSGNRISVRFGINTALEGFSDDCAQNLTVGPRVSPMPPPIPEDYGCQSELLLSRISPAIPQLSE